MHTFGRNAKQGSTHQRRNIWVEGAERFIQWDPRILDKKNPSITVTRVNLVSAT